MLSRFFLRAYISKVRLFTRLAGIYLDFEAMIYAHLVHSIRAGSVYRLIKFSTRRPTQAHLLLLTRVSDERAEFLITRELVLCRMALLRYEILDKLFRA